MEIIVVPFFFFFFFNDTATTEIYTLSLHDALPIFRQLDRKSAPAPEQRLDHVPGRSEEHTSELQSPCNLVCRLLLEKKKQRIFDRSDEKYAEHLNHRHDTDIAD